MISLKSINIKTILLITAFIILNNILLSSSFFEVGGRSNGLGNANVSMIDLFALYHNQAASAFLKEKRIGFFSENKYITRELQTYGLATALPYRKGVFGFTLTRFGFSSFHQSQLGLSLAKKLSQTFALGLKINGMQRYIEGFTPTLIVYEELSMLSKITKKITLGTQFVNILRPSLNTVLPQESTVFKCGASYTQQEYRLFLNIYKDLDKAFNTKVGLEYLLLSSFAIRAGINTMPSQFFAGFGLLHELLSIDFSIAYLNDLGFSPSLSLHYAL